MREGKASYTIDRCVWGMLCSLLNITFLEGVFFKDDYVREKEMFGEESLNEIFFLLTDTKKKYFLLIFLYCHAKNSHPLVA